MRGPWMPGSAYALPVHPESRPEAVTALYTAIADAYTQRYFSDLSDAWIVEELVAALAPISRVLDVGCGPGTFTRYLAGRGLHAEGIDLSPDMLRIAGERVPEATFRQMDMRVLAYPDGTFDGVLAAYSLIHIPDAEVVAVLAEFRRVLRPGGVLLVLGQRGASDHVEDDPLAPGERVFVNFLDAEALRRDLVEAGFWIHRLEQAGSADAESMSAGIVWALGER